jgi:hypothetical protein
MQIDPDILITWGAIAKKIKKGEFIFHEGDYARFYFQILEGTIKMFNTNLDGKEFTQSEFKAVEVLENLLCLSMKITHRQLLHVRTQLY